MRYWTADLHLGHENILRYCHRPFADVAAMNRALVGAWNTTVADQDEVWAVGDFALGRIAETLPFAQEPRGRRKVLVPGNHDRCWAGHGPRAERWVGQYLAAGFDEVRQGPVTVTLAGRTLLVDHFPHEGDSRSGPDRYVAHRPPDNGGWLIHGHVHGRWRQRGRMINVGVDAWGGRPVSDTELIELIAAGPADLPPLGWRVGE